MAVISMFSGCNLHATLATLPTSWTHVRQGGMFIKPSGILESQAGGGHQLFCTLHNDSSTGSNTCVVPKDHATTVVPYYPDAWGIPVSLASLLSPNGTVTYFINETQQGSHPAPSTFTNETAFWFVMTNSAGGHPHGILPSNPPTNLNITLLIQTFRIWQRTSASTNAASRLPTIFSGLDWMAS